VDRCYQIFPEAAVLLGCQQGEQPHVRTLAPVLHREDTGLVVFPYLVVQLAPSEIDDALALEDLGIRY